MTTSRNHRSQTIRALAMTIGAVLGMSLSVVGPQAAMAAKIKTKAQKAAVAEKLEPLPEAAPEQMAAADRVLIGRYDCEFGKRLSVDRNDKNPGYINMSLGKELWVAKPVLSSTGALRLEDVKGRVLLLQILTKSMLMDTTAGRRLVDGCVHEVQRAAEDELRKHPQPANLTMN